VKLDPLVIIAPLIRLDLDLWRFVLLKDFSAERALFADDVSVVIFLFNTAEILPESIMSTKLKSIKICFDDKILNFIKSIKN